jgi:hypothetical protein
MRSRFRKDRNEEDFEKSRFDSKMDSEDEPRMPSRNQRDRYERSRSRYKEDSEDDTKKSFIDYDE